MAEHKKTQMGTEPSRASSAFPAATPAVTPAPEEPKQHATSYLPPIAVQEDPLIGQTLAERYHITKKLGEGGMGAVYLATHKLLEKQVALKVLHGEFACKPDLVERFMQEAKSASKIRHENVIDISDFGVTPDGLVFFAMELLKGHDLHEEIAKARAAGELLPWERSRPIFLQICAALIAAHEKGIIHRDLKPENIYLVEFLGQPDFVKLLDFGIAKLTEVSESDRKLTRTGMLFGTPEYMSPEQARGENADARVDVYAMGCILYQLVTGRVPFEADNFMSVLTMHLTEPVPEIPQAVFNAIGAPAELGEIIYKGLEKDRNQRWETILDFANAIRVLSGEEPLAAGPQAKQLRASVAMPAARPALTQNQGKATHKTNWTGSVRLPDDEDDASFSARKPAKSKAPLIAAAVLVVGAGGVTAFVLGRSGSSGSSEGSAGSSVDSGGSAIIGSAGSAIAGSPVGSAVGSGSAIVAVEPAIPDNVTLTIVTVPTGVEIRDAKGNVRGTTPNPIIVPGSKVAQIFTLQKKNYKKTTLEVVLVKDASFTLTLERGSGEAQAKVDTVKSTPQIPGNGSATPAGSGMSNPPPPDKGSGTATVKQTQDPPPNVGSNQVKDPGTKPGSAEEPDDPDVIKLKVPFGSGSGSN